MGGASLLLLGASLVLLLLAGAQPRGSARSLILTVAAALFMVGALITGLTTIGGR